MTDTSVSISDVQGASDARRIAIDEVGIRALRHPVTIVDRHGGRQHTVAVCSLHVGLLHSRKGAHMSRFVEVLAAHGDDVSVVSFEHILRTVMVRLEADSGGVEIVFPYFVEKVAPVSRLKSLLDYEVTFAGEIRNGKYTFTMKAVVPTTSLCPCSKEISAYGAHNQRSHVSISIQGNRPVWVEELIDLAESQASCGLYGLLKRADEKYVTEKAYDNPKFVEDTVRDIAAVLDQDERVDRYTVESENFESIHNHSAYARIERDKSKSA